LSDVDRYFCKAAQELSWKTFVSETQSPSCDKQVQLEKPLCSLPTRMPQILLRQVEEIFPGVKEGLVFCTETILMSP